MNTLNFTTSSVDENAKSQFDGTLFHNNEQWLIIRYEGAIADGSSTDNKNPVLIVNKVVNGQTVGEEQRLFISSLYRNDFDIDGVEVPKSGTLNNLVKKVWDNPKLLSDKACFESLFKELDKKMHIVCHRTSVPKDSKNPKGPKFRVERYSRETNLLQMNWDIA